MRNTSLCYIERGREYLMLHRVKKENDENRDKWIGVGGKFEEGESPDECMLREMREETGLTALSWRFRGIVTFVSDEWGTEYMHRFTCNEYTGSIKECSEGVLEWLDRDALMNMSIWEGDRIFLRLLDEDAPFFLLKLCYSGDALTRAVLNGHELPLGH